MNSMTRIYKTAEVLKKGGVALISTDTVCGLAALPGNTCAIERIYEIKKRDPSKPLALLIPSIEWVWKWVDKNEEIKKICEENWPGAVTLIMMTKEGETIGLRMPDCPPLLRLMEITGPICATSANVSCQPAPIQVNQVCREIKDKCDIIDDLGVKPDGKPSSVIDITGPGRDIVRQ